MDMSSESSAARWYEPPRTSLEPPSAAAAGVAGVVGNPTDYRGYYPHAGPTPHHPAAAAAHYAHSEYDHLLLFFLFYFSFSFRFFFFYSFFCYSLYMYLFSKDFWSSRLGIFIKVIFFF
ncbi:hypothetical protein M0804_015510 [Polistes exclamans]|nr:hypothetical protein M0804_015510 [Polistes exclamans]